MSQNGIHFIMYGVVTVNCIMIFNVKCMFFLIRYRRLELVVLCPSPVRASPRTAELWAVPTKTPCTALTMYALPITVSICHQLAHCTTNLHANYKAN